MSAASIPPVVLPEHRKVGIAVAVGCVLLALLILFIFTFEMADPPPREIPMNTTTSLTDLEIKDLKVETGGAGGGTPSNDPIHEVTPQTEKILTQKKNSKSSSNTGESNKTNANNHTNTATTTAQDDENHFGGEDGGQGGGRGENIGKTDGTNYGDGSEGGIKRVRKNDPNVENIEVDRLIFVYLKMTIDANGEIITARSTSKTTTTDQRIINRVISEVKRQVRYNKDPDSTSATVYMTVRLNSK
jgi:hypothetical protein